MIIDVGPSVDLTDPKVAAGKNCYGNYANSDGKVVFPII